MQKIKKYILTKIQIKRYNTNYSDGYFRILDNGQVQFSISEDKAQFLLKNKLENKRVKYKNINN